MNDKCTHPDGHDWETLWDDGERDCRVCTACGVERIFVHDATFNRDPGSPHLCPRCGNHMHYVERLPGGMRYWECWDCEDEE